ncbi:MAG: hypothetical protein JNL98_01265 [Bryobacterales bacterium]|nr:hypothetical protein [Bryobacterales bacterium]
MTVRIPKSSRKVRLALATVALASASAAWIGPGTSIAFAYPTCTSLGCSGGALKCATFTVSGVGVTCYTRS